MQTNMPYSGKKNATKAIISKEEKQVPRFKAGRDRLNPLFCANAVRFIIRITFIYKAANPRALKGKDKHQLPFLVVQQGGLDNKNPFSGLVP